MGNVHENEMFELLEARALVRKARDRYVKRTVEELWCHKSPLAKDVEDLFNACDIVVNGLSEVIDKLQGDGNDGRAA